MAEEQRFGLEKSLKRRAEELGLPLPGFAMDGDYLVLTIYRTLKAAVRALPDAARESLSTAELAGWEWLSRQRSVTSAAYARAMAIPARTAQNHLKRFVELDMVRRYGSARSTRYEVKRSRPGADSGKESGRESGHGGAISVGAGPPNGNRAKNRAGMAGFLAMP